MLQQSFINHILKLCYPYVWT